jgi:hypothetical protein
MMALRRNVNMASDPGHEDITVRLLPCYISQQQHCLLAPMQILHLGSLGFSNISTASRRTCPTVCKQRHDNYSHYNCTFTISDIYLQLCLLNEKENHSLPNSTAEL